MTTTTADKGFDPARWTYVPGPEGSRYRRLGIYQCKRCGYGVYPNASRQRADHEATCGGKS